jgi:hypothetical protein
LFNPSPMSVIVGVGCCTTVLYGCQQLTSLQVTVSVPSLEEDMTPPPRPGGTTASSGSSVKIQPVQAVRSLLLRLSRDPRERESTPQFRRQTGSNKPSRALAAWTALRPDPWSHHLSKKVTDAERCLRIKISLRFGYAPSSTARTREVTASTNCSNRDGWPCQIACRGPTRWPPCACRSLYALVAECSPSWT